MLAIAIAWAVFWAGCRTGEPQARFIRQVDWAERGSWMKVDTHVHSEFSDGAHSVSEIAASAREYGCDAIAITDHADRSRDAASVEYFYDIEAARRQFPNLMIMAGLEWNVPPWGGDEHATVLLPEGFDLDLAEFKEHFDDHGREAHDSERAVEALMWLAERTHADGAQAVVIHNHPSRMNASSLDVMAAHQEWRRVNDTVIGFSGAPGHQAGEVNGAYEDWETTIDRWDPAVARPGDAWDRLLHSGADTWAARAPSDFHNPASRGVGDYWPGQFSETWVYVPERTINGVLRGMRAGSFFAGHGHIVREVDLLVESPGLYRPAYSGEAIEVSQSQPIRISLRCEIPEFDWEGRPNRVDLLELIAISEEGARVVATVQPSSHGVTHLLTTPDSPESVVYRARGRRIDPDRADLLFYTNPIRVNILPSPLASWERVLPEPSIRTLLGLLVGVLVLLSAGSHVLGRRKRPAVVSGALVNRSSEFVGSAGYEPHHPSVEPQFSASSVPTRWFLGLAILSASFAMYVSLLPFEFQKVELNAAWQQFVDNIDTFPSLRGRGRVDFFGNVLLLVPFGFGMMGSRNASLARPKRAAAAGIMTLMAAVAISLTNELTQAALPRRVPSPADACAQVLGAGFGIILWFVTGTRISSWLTRFQSSQRRLERRELILRGYFIVLFLVSVVPLDLTIHPGDILEKYRLGRINLNPFDGFAFSGPVALNLAFHAMCFVPVGMLALTVLTTDRQPGRSLFHATIVGAGLVMCIELAQLLVFSRFTDVTDVIVGTTGILLGASIGRRFVSENLNSATTTSSTTAWWWMGLAALYLAIPCCYLWWPFEFVVDAQSISHRLDGMLRLPFQSLVISSSPMNAISLLVQRTFLFIPFGLLLGHALQSLSPRQNGGKRVMIIGVLATASVSAVFELGQAFIPQRVPDPTDILLATMGGTVGLLISSSMCKVQVEPSKRAAHG